MIIRRMGAKDREAWIALTKEFYRTDAVLHPVPEEYFAATFDAMTSGSPYLDGFVALENSKAVGSLQVSLTWSNEAGGPVVWLEELYVTPERRGNGIASALFRHVLTEYAGKAARFRLEAEPGNESAMRLYRKLGFRELPYTQMILMPEKERENNETV